MPTLPFNHAKKYPLPPDRLNRLPHNLDAEKAILGAILVDNTLLPKVLEGLSIEDFFLSQNAVIFRHIVEISKRGCAIDLITLVDELSREKYLEAAGGAGYVASLIDGIPKIANVNFYVELVKEDAKRRILIHFSYKIQQMGLEENTTSEDLRNEMDLFLKHRWKNACANRLAPIECGGLLLMDVEPVNFVIEPILPVKGIGMIYAWRGVGKTFFAMEMAYCVATGAEECNKKCFVWNVPQRRRVLYVDGEMDVETLQERCREIARGHHMRLPEDDYLRFITPDLQKKFMPKINTKEGQAAIEAHLLPGDLVILDNLAALCPSSQEDETGDWVMVQEWLLHLRHSGITVLFMHHAGKGGAQRGFSGKEDLINVTINLRRGDGYQMEEQLRAEVHLEKVRGKSAVGTWVQPFEIILNTDNGVAQWLQRPLREIIEKRAFQMFAAGMKPNDIAQDLRLNRYQVYRLRKKFEGGYKPDEE